MKLIVGLGNPGPKYVLTRHNIGFLAVDSFLEIHGPGSWKTEHKAQVAKLRLGTEQVILAKPQTFMNLSGESVQALMSFYSLQLSDLLVVHDEVDIKFGAMRFQAKRSHGGHNGIRDIHARFGDAYARLRLGVGRPPQFVDDDGKSTRPAMDVADWVLQNFSSEEQKALPDFLELGCRGIQTFIESGLEKAANQYNGKG